MANVDIVARLALRAEQFSSETGRAFAEMKTRAASAASEIRGSFNQSFAEVQRLAQSALTLPRTTGGSLDLSSEISQLRAAESAAEQNAAAQRELSVAFTAAANASREGAQALRLDADAAAVASLASEKDAAAIRDRIVALEAVQGELNKTTSATDRHAASLAKAGISAGQQRAAMQQLGYQLGDVAQGFAVGTPPVTIFAQQIGQVTQAVGMMTNSTKGFLGFIGGPWGAVITAGLVVLTPFVAKLFEVGAAEKVAELGASGLSDAQSALGQMFDLTTGKAKSFNGALAQQAELIRLNIQLTALKLRAEGISESANSARDLGRAGNISNLSLGAWLVGGRGLSEDPRLAGVVSERRSIVSDLKRGALSPSDALRRAGALPDVGGMAVDKAGFEKAIVDMVSGRLKTGIADRVDKVLDTGKLDPVFRQTGGGSRGGGRGPTARSAREDGATPRDIETITRINEQWDRQPRLIDQAAKATRELAAIEEKYRGKTDAVSKGILDSVAHTRELIEVEKNRPFDDYVKAQEESLAVGKLLLAGRESEASVLQDIVRLEQQQGPLTTEQIARVTALAKQQERIRDLIEDQQRVIGISTGFVHNLQQSFDSFLSDLETRPDKALGGMASGFVNSFKQLQRDLLSNAIFGGVDRDIAKYVRELTGQQTPKEIIDEQAKGAGVALGDFADTVEGITFRLSGGLGSLTSGAKGFSGIPPASAIQALINANAANDNGSDLQDIVVTASRSQTNASLKTVQAVEIFTRVADRIEDNLDKLGVHIPAEIAKALPGALQGASIFSSIGAGFGGKGGTYGGILGAGLGSILSAKQLASFSQAGQIYQLAESVTLPIAKALGLDKTNTRLGGLVGGLIGKVLGIGPHTPAGGTVLTSAYGTPTTHGNNSDARAAAAGAGSSVQQALIGLAQQFGTSLGAFNLSIGEANGQWSVDPLGLNRSAKNGKGGVAFGTDQQAALEYAIRDAVRDGALMGLSAASQKILSGTGDLDTAVHKALLIEAIPHDLKAMLDPVGSAIDDLNKKWKETVDALNEGGASAEQYADAEKLYKLQLDQVKASTASASQGLKDFLASLNFGSASPYSLRDQEAAAKAALDPYLATISAGGTIDQSKYQSAAQAFLDIERQLYGSTQDYFSALDSIQAMTAKAIATIDNAVPITPGVPDPFTKSTSDNTRTLTEQTDDTNELLRTNNALLAKMIAALGGGTSGFIGEVRGFRQDAA